MNAFERSWMITKLTFSVINKDRELLGFAFLSFVFSTLFAIAMIVPSVVPTIVDNGYSAESLEIYQYIIIFLTYFGLAFIATFFNVCVVYTTKTRFEGGNATFGESIKFAFTRIGVIFQWSLISATVGLLLRLLHDLASRLPKIGEIIANIIISLMGMAWSILTIFVVPVLVYEGTGPIDAIKKSAQVIRKTWGESIIRSIGLGLVQVIVILLVIVLSIAVCYGLGYAFSVWGVIVGVCLGLALILLTALIFSVANTIFNTALFVYANQNNIPEGFSEQVVRDAFRRKD